jgi:hypothetical protein
MTEIHATDVGGRIRLEVLRPGRAAVVFVLTAAEAQALGERLCVLGATAPAPEHQPASFGPAVPTKPCPRCGVALSATATDAYGHPSPLCTACRTETAAAQRQARDEQQRRAQADLAAQVAAEGRGRQVRAERKVRDGQAA